MDTVKFGIIGCGLMGREFGSAAARWFHLADMDVRPEIVAVCDVNDDLTSWFTENLSSVKQVTKDYKALLANPEVEAVYVAVPHNLHQDICCNTPGNNHLHYLYLSPSTHLHLIFLQYNQVRLV